MMPLMIRGIIIYLFVIAAVRLMGKRQIGELQPAELVITILMSDIASMPLQNDETPLLQCLVSIFLLVALEVIFSVVTMKSRTFRKLLQGNSVMVICNGRLVEKNMKLIRYSVDDLMEALRLKDVFDISQVSYAYVETNGSISVMLKKADSPLTPSDLNIKTENEPIPCLVISDGKIIEREFEICALTKAKLYKILSSKNLSPENVLIMTYSSNGKVTIIEKKE